MENPHHRQHKNLDGYLRSITAQVRKHGKGALTILDLKDQGLIGVKTQEGVFVLKAEALTEAFQKDVSKSPRKPPVDKVVAFFREKFEAALAEGLRLKKANLHTH